MQLPPPPEAPAASIADGKVLKARDLKQAFASASLPVALPPSSEESSALPSDCAPLSNEPANAALSGSAPPEEGGDFEPLSLEQGQGCVGAPRYDGGEIKELPGVHEEHIKEAFDSIDFDGNGFLGVSELRYVLTASGEQFYDEELDEMIRMIDTRGDGQVSMQDFLQLFAPGNVVLAEMSKFAPQIPEPKVVEVVEKLVPGPEEEAEMARKEQERLQKLESAMAAFHWAKDTQMISAEQTAKKGSALPESRRQAKREWRQQEAARLAARPKNLPMRVIRAGFGLLMPSQNRTNPLIAAQQQEAEMGARDASPSTRQMGSTMSSMNTTGGSERIGFSQWKESRRATNSTAGSRF